MIRPMNRSTRDSASLGLLAACLAAAVGLAPAPLRADPPPVARQNHPQKVAEVAADLGYGSELKHIAAAVPYLAKNVLPNDSTWNSTNARWPAVCTLIRQNLRDDAQEAFSGTEAAIVEKAEHVLNDAVSDAQIDATLAFFKSAPGRHFLELQESMTEMSVEVGLDGDPGTGNVVDNLDSRKRVLQLWLPVVFIHVMYPPSSADWAVDTVYQQFAKKRGQQLDALAQRYADELAQFEAFVKSDNFNKIIDAEKQTGQDTPSPNLATFFSDEARKRAAQWHAAAAPP
jgi:exonuclease III